MTKQTLRCITAPNPGMMTGNGTNSYVLGNGIAVVDPGPDNARHIDALLDAVGAQLKYILVTHTHRDHSPASRQLSAETGAIVVGQSAPPGDNQDRSFAPDYIPQHDETLELAGLHIRAIHTPGHASNHVCYFDTTEAVLFSGDHINQGTTVVIPPPDGSMRSYLESLELLKQYPIKAIAPGHGSMIPEPLRAIESLIRHRLQRESKTLNRLQELAVSGAVSLDRLLLSVYDDVPALLHPVARLSLLAHLEKLEADGRVLKFAADSTWALT